MQWLQLLPPPHNMFAICYCFMDIGTILESHVTDNKMVTLNVYIISNYMTQLAQQPQGGKVSYKSNLALLDSY